MPDDTAVIVSPCSQSDLHGVETLWPRRGCDVRYARQEAGDSAFLLARVGDTVLGRAEVMWNGPRMDEVAVEHPQVPEINGLDVLPDARRRGIGTALVTAAEAMARDNGHRAIGLGVGRDNPEAERLYRRLGYDGTFEYTDTYVWRDEQGAAHDAADHCRFLIKSLT